MLRLAAILAGIATLFAAPAAAQDRAVVEASPPSDIAVTVYRDPDRGPWQELDLDDPRGFAMISETRTVTLPPGRSTIRFEGVAEGMVAVSAIVSGLPGGTIEKNRNADLLSPAALVDGTLGNRVTVTRTNPATGAAVSERAIVRTRADGGLVLQTSAGFEAVRCSGLPERLTFGAVPDGLSAQPVFTIDTASEGGGTFTVTLSYLSWGFDWQADYVAAVHEGRAADDLRFDLASWLTILNDNGQSFANAELMAVAGTLNIVSDLRALADPPQGEPLRLDCYPIGSTAAGSPVPRFPGYAEEEAERIVVTGARMATMEMAADAAPPAPPPPPVLAGEENLGDLKLYRMPVPVTVNAQGLKQVAFLREEDVEGRLLYQLGCSPWASSEVFNPAAMLLATVNDAAHGLGMALPSGAVAIFERSAAGELLVGTENLRDYASGQDVELAIGASAQVFGQCLWDRGANTDGWRTRWTAMRTELSNANPEPVTVRVLLGSPRDWRFRKVREAMHNGQRIVEVTVPGNSTRTLEWDVRPAAQ